MSVPSTVGPLVAVAVLAALVGGAVALWFRGTSEGGPVDREGVLEAIADGLVVLDDQRSVRACAGGAERFGTLDSPVGSPFEEAFPALAGDGDDLDQQTVCLDGDGRKRYLDVRSSTTDADEAVLALYDVTDRVVRDQRLDVLGYVLRYDRFDESVAGGSEGASGGSVLKEAARGGSERADRREVETALDRASGERHPLDAATIARNVVADARETHPDATFAVDTPESAYASAHESLSQAVREVVENAVEHHDATAPPTVEVSVHRTEDAVAVSVADDGPGIPEAERAVFDREQTALERGSGLGLWLVRWVLQASSGDVVIKDRDPRGSIVRLVLPRADSVQDEPDDAMGAAFD